MRMSMIVDDLGSLFDATLILLATLDALIARHDTVTFDLFLSTRDARHGLAISTLGRRSRCFGLLLLLLRYRQHVGVVGHIEVVGAHIELR